MSGLRKACVTFDWVVNVKYVWVVIVVITVIRMFHMYVNKCNPLQSKMYEKDFDLL